MMSILGYDCADSENISARRLIKYFMIWVELMNTSILYLILSC